MRMWTSLDRLTTRPPSLRPLTTWKEGEVGEAVGEGEGEIAVLILVVRVRRSGIVVVVVGVKYLSTKRWLRGV